MNVKNRILVSILLLLCPFTLRAQTSYGGIQTDFIYFDDSKFQGNMAFYSAAISTVSTVSQSGFTETVNTTAANNFTTGMKCGLVQVANPALNFSAGSQTLGGITVVSSTQFTFARPENQSISQQRWLRGV